MNYTYEVIDEKLIKRTDENNQVLWIPTDPANKDYAAYLADPTGTNPPTTPTATPTA